MKKTLCIAFILLGFLTTGFSQEIIIESRSEGKNYSWYSETSGNWSDSVAKSLADGCSPESIGSRFVIIDGGPANAQARFTPVLPKEGKYDIYVTWGRSGNAFNTKYIINTGTTEEVKYLDQSGWGGALAPNPFVWLHLGTYDLPAGNKAFVAVDASEVKGKPSEENSGRVYSDAVKFVPYDPSAPPPAAPAASSQPASTFTPYTQPSTPFSGAPSVTSQFPSTTQQVPSSSSGSPSPGLPFVPLGSTSSQQPATSSQTFPQPSTQQAASPFSRSTTPFSQQTPMPFSQPGVVTYSQATPSPFSQPGTTVVSQATPSPFTQPGTPFSQATPSPFSQPGTTVVSKATPSPFTQANTPFSQATPSPFTQPGTSAVSQPGTPFSQAPSSMPPIQSTASLQWYTSYSEAIQAGVANNKSIMLFFRSALGKSSNIMENDVLNNPEVKAKLLQYFVCCKLDITQNRPICDYYGIFKAPVLVFLDARGYSRARIDNLLDPDELSREMEKYK